MHILLYLNFHICFDIFFLWISWVYASYVLIKYMELKLKS
jgi:hypothetical protein